ncbi:MAG: NAD-dependent epimerase [Cellvibrionales bacterium]|nr:NAD-dependent epimerase [Cellvibrionales bacterium]
MANRTNTLVTGAAGFIGFHAARRLLDRGEQLVGLDNLNAYYDPALKRARLKQLESPNFHFVEGDLACRPTIEKLFAQTQFDRVLHLGAQAGVRYSVENPPAYIDSNLVGTGNILEACRQAKVQHLVYASSSSVYGLNTRLPFATTAETDHPASLYAATKKANELMAHSYAHLYRLPTTGLRFFTVYGPWGRPDMALFRFTESILAGRPIQVFNHGQMQRDFTYIDDIIEGVLRVLDRPPAPNPNWQGTAPDPASSTAPYRLYNIGNNAPVALLDCIAALESALGTPAKKQFLPMQPGDLPATCADVDDLTADFGFHPATPLETGIAKFIDWYRTYFQI